MLNKYKPIIFLFVISLFILINIPTVQSQNATNSQTTITSSWYNLLPDFIKNFIRNITNFSEEKLTPAINHEVGDIINNPGSQSTQQTFFDKIKSRLSNLSQEINNFFKLDVGSAFQKIMNLFIYGFNKGVEFIKNLFS